GNSMIGLCCSAIGSSDTRNPARVFELRAGPAPQSHRFTANQRRGSYSLPPRLQSINLNGRMKPPNGAEPNAASDADAAKGNRSAQKPARRVSCEGFAPLRMGIIWFRKLNRA